MAKARTVKAKTKSRSRYKNDPFLKALGVRCRQLRLEKGYSIDRLYKESEQLSPASIDRLEKGLADSQILVLARYAETLQVPLVELFSFTTEDTEIKQDQRIIPYDEGERSLSGHVPVYPLKVAAGKFAQPHSTESIKPSGWVDARIRANEEQYFAAVVRGESMEPLIKNGSLCLFKKYTGGSRQGKIFLVQAGGLQNPETGDAFVVKKYQRQTPAKTSDDESCAVIHLVSVNPLYPPIVLVGLDDDSVSTIAEFVRVL